MPKITSFVPSWLNEPAPGHKLFAPATDDARQPNPQLFSSKPKTGPRRTIARRGSEVFVAVGKQIRWGSLVQLKESWEAKQSKSIFGTRFKKEGSDGSFELYDEEAETHGAHNGAEYEGYRLIKTPVADDIRQLVMSPNEDYLAVLTTHTVHICILPDSSHLSAHDGAPFRPKFWTLGPTTHVTSRPAVVSAIWHPLGVHGSSLVTVTGDSVVRVWELSATDRWSFDRPTLAIDLKKLADGTYLDQDFSASTSTTNTGFSPDSFDMKAVSACFGDRRSGGWSPMTLWIAMAGGDVYALCPLLPSKWAPPPTLVPALSVSIVAKVAATEDDAETSPGAKRLAQQQLDWMADLDGQDPMLVDGLPGEAPTEVYTRPAKPGAVPKLQGPFVMDLAPEAQQEDDATLTDILVIGEKISTGDLMFGEDADLDVDDDDDGLSLSVVCLLTVSGRVQIYLDMDGVQAQWLPKKSARSRGYSLESEDDLTSLLSFQTLDTLTPTEMTMLADNWPVFSTDANSRYSFFVTQPSGITFVSLTPWVFRLEAELQAESEAGSKFRIDLLVKANGSTREKVYTQKPEQGLLAAPVAFRDPDLGYFILSAGPRAAVAVFFDAPEDEYTPTIRQASPTPAYDDEDDRKPLTIWEPRPYFHASDALDAGTHLPQLLDNLKAGRRKPLMQQEVRLSAATLEVFADSHRVISADIHPLNVAVAELFRKCEALQAELRDQIGKTNEVRRRVEAISGEDVRENEEPVSDNMHVRNRLSGAQKRQEELAERMQRLKSRLGKATSRKISDYEKAWMGEVKALESTVLGMDGAADGPSPSKAKSVPKRLDEIKRLKDDLATQIARLQKPGEGEEEEPPSSPAKNGLQVPLDIKKAKYAQVRTLLDRESALVGAVKSRLERLSVG
ncbi:Nucleoporin NUP82 [Coniochaeta hoffmannii]|uniref:Nucleoporin NUP82 n=1 Tax=Coniochaeta hoffmannii TaxID=91930 RepID=A0AA38RR56_9PEZI|nr:Nucleoporin NUP82 [Coniochaeta hoffmannii]